MNSSNCTKLRHFQSLQPVLAAHLQMLSCITVCWEVPRSKRSSEAGQGQISRQGGDVEQSLPGKAGSCCPSFWLATRPPRVHLIGRLQQTSCLLNMVEFVWRIGLSHYTVQVYIFMESHWLHPKTIGAWLWMSMEGRRPSSVRVSYLFE